MCRLTQIENWRKTAKIPIFSVIGHKNKINLEVMASTVISLYLKMPHTFSSYDCNGFSAKISEKHPKLWWPLVQVNSDLLAHLSTLPVTPSSTSCFHRALSTCDEGAIKTLIDVDENKHYCSLQRALERLFTFARTRVNFFFSVLKFSRISEKPVTKLKRVKVRTFGFW